ncbi:hypothetical protein GOBAR_DD23486 [Gossypium barbadense]|nr:hypothetical protein GOBAR_DD23486 [Gossypium barbadense]
MVVEAGYRVVRHFAYCNGEVDFSKGLSVFYDNSSLIAMINHIRKRGFIHVYVEHEIDTLDVVNDTMLLPISREKDVNIGVREPNCNEELNCNERVNGGAGETFIELGGESNVGPDFSRSSDACVKSGEKSESSRASDIDNSLGSDGTKGTESEDEEFVREYFLSKIRVVPKLKLIEMLKLTKEELKVDLSRGTCSRARK